MWHDTEHSSPCPFRCCCSSSCWAWKSRSRDHSIEAGDYSSPWCLVLGACFSPVQMWQRTECLVSHGRHATWQAVPSDEDHQAMGFTWASVSQIGRSHHAAMSPASIHLLISVGPLRCVFPKLPPGDGCAWPVSHVFIAPSATPHLRISPHALAHGNFHNSSKTHPLFLLCNIQNF